MDTSEMQTMKLNDGQSNTPDNDVTANQATADPVAPSAAAKRMRLHRYRRQQGLGCVIAELRETELDTLVRMGLLQAEMRNDPKAIKRALHEFLDDTLV
jgi:hypothetical protein